MNEQCNGWGLVTGATEDDGTRHDTTLIAGAGGQIPVEVFRPASATGSAVVIGAEATGPNRFVRTVARRLAVLGHTVVIPDYYRGTGAPDPDDYDNLAPVRELIAELDFRRASFDVLDAIRWARGLDGVDSQRIAVWGYCTGATLTFLAAALDPALAAAVLFYPSQPVFDTIDAAHPAHALDLMWAIRAPLLTFYGNRDHAFPADVRERFENGYTRWHIPGRLVVYPDADHVFAGAMPDRYRQDYDEDSWRIATSFLDEHLTTSIRT